MRVVFMVRGFSFLYDIFTPASVFLCFESAGKTRQPKEKTPTKEIGKETPVSDRG